MAPSLSCGILVKLKAQPTTASFATVNQMFGGSSQLSTTAQLHNDQIVEHISDNKNVLRSSRKLGRAVEHLIDVSKKCINFC